MNKNQKKKANPHTMKRVGKTLLGFYPVLLPVTLVCILLSAATALVPDIFIKNVIEVIEQWSESSNWAEASKTIIPMMILLSSIYLVSLIAAFVYTQLTAVITQGALAKFRNKMFDGMQNLPIKYFDTHKHGDIMSHYTNDIDTLRQLISQAIPSVLRAGSVVICVFIYMLYLSIWMTLILTFGVIVMIVVSKKLGGGSSKFFIRQQNSLGMAEGYIQEMMNGQKVIKVFCREEETKNDFNKLNEALYNDSYKANAYANSLGPIIMNIGNVLYVIMAVAGGVFYLLNILCKKIKI